jgi:hypothetical protein
MKEIRLGVFVTHTVHLLHLLCIILYIYSVHQLVDIINTWKCLEKDVHYHKYFEEILIILSLCIVLQIFYFSIIFVLGDLFKEHAF